VEMLITRLEKERVQQREKMESENEVQQQQLQNMMAADMEQAEKERQAFIKENNAEEERFLEMQKSNEENMKMMKTLSELIARHEGEKMKLCAQMTALPKEQMEASLKEMNDRHSEEVRVLLEKINSQIEKMKKSLSDEEEKKRAANFKELAQLMNSRKAVICGQKQRIGEIEKEKEAVEKPDFIWQVLKYVAKAAPVAAGGLALVSPPAARIAVLTAAFATIVSEYYCSIM